MNFLTAPPMGCPSKYNEETIVKTRWYFDNWKKLNHAIPSIAGLADFLEVDRGTVRRWAMDEEKADFCTMLSRLLTRQELILFNQGLSNELNSNIVKLALAKHGYSDRSEVATFDAGSNGKDKDWSVESVSPDQQKDRVLIEQLLLDVKQLTEDNTRLQQSNG